MKSQRVFSVLAGRTMRLAALLILIGQTAVFSQTSNSAEASVHVRARLQGTLVVQQQNPKIREVRSGEKVKASGVVTVRRGDSFRVRDDNGAETSVILTADTKVSSHNGRVRGKKAYPVTYIRRGLRLQAQGTGDAEGNLVAEWVQFDEQDLRSAQALKRTDEVVPADLARIETAEEKEKREAGPITENKAPANDPRARADVEQKAKAPQAQADAVKAAVLPDNRINGLDEYDTIRTVPVLFKVNSSIIDTTAKHIIDDAVGWAKGEKSNENRKDWFVEVVGFADTAGDTAKNRALSERRAKAVIQYLVGVHNLDLRRVFQPFGYGDSKPVADNKTAAGRAKNRGVEIRILQNKGIARSRN